MRNCIKSDTISVCHLHITILRNFRVWQFGGIGFQFLPNKQGLLVGSPHSNDNSALGSIVGAPVSEAPSLGHGRAKRRTKKEKLMGCFCQNFMISVY